MTMSESLRKQIADLVASNRVVLFMKGTDASVHDSQVLGEVLRKADDGGAVMDADSAYRSVETEADLQARALTRQIHEAEWRSKQ